MHSAQAASAARLGQTSRGTPSFNPSMCGSCTRMSLPDAVGDTRWVSVGVCLTVRRPRAFHGSFWTSSLVACAPGPPNCVFCGKLKTCLYFGVCMTRAEAAAARAVRTWAALDITVCQCTRPGAPQKPCALARVRGPSSVHTNHVHFNLSKEAYVSVEHC